MFARSLLPAIGTLVTTSAARPAAASLSIAVRSTSGEAPEGYVYVHKD